MLRCQGCSILNPPARWVGELEDMGSKGNMAGDDPLDLYRFRHDDDG